LAVDMTDLEVRAAIDGGISFLQYRKRKEARSKWEKWSVAVALARKVGEKTLERVVNCPGLDCDNAFLVSAISLSLKTSREPKTRLSNALSLRYRPPLSGTAGKDDARRVWCDSCAAAFCGVCRGAWTRPRRYGVGGTDPFAPVARAPAVDSHYGKSCVGFAGKGIKRRLAEQASVFVSEQIKPCPFCGLAVERIEGCNHVSCRCGGEWCFVCGLRWGRKHYACRNLSGVSYMARGGGQRGVKECQIM